MVAPGDLSALAAIIAAVLGALSGYASAFFGFRARLAIDDQRFARIERRQQVTLEMVADVARALNLDHRFSDGLLKFLSEEKQ